MDCVDPERFGSWLAGIALNVARMWARRRTAMPLGRLTRCWAARWSDEPISPEPDPAAHAEAVELTLRVRSAVANLPRGQRAAVLLFYLAGLSHLEVAEHLGVPVGAVKTRLHKARLHLRRTLDLAEAPVTSDLVEMRIYDVVRQPEREDAPLPRIRWLIRLEEVDGERLLDIGIGRFEGESLALALGRVEVLRPLTFAFTASLLRAAGARLTEVRINRLEAKTLYAQAIVETASGTQSIDARPSDALNLAVVQGAPIYVSAEVFVALAQDAVAKVDPDAASLDVLVAEARANVDHWRREAAADAQERP